MRDVKVMQVSSAKGRSAPVGALDRLRILTRGLIATALLAAVAALASSQAGTLEAPRSQTAALAASTQVGASFHDTLLVPVIAVASHGTNSQRSAPNSDVGVVAVTALITFGIFVTVRRAGRPHDVVPELLPQRRAPPRGLSLR